MRMTRPDRTSSGHCGLLTMALLAVLAPAAMAQEPVEAPDYIHVSNDGELVLSPVEAARWALERNTNVRIQAEGIPEAEGRLEEARAADGLSVKLSGTALRMGPVSSFELPFGGEGEDGEGQAREVTVGQDHMYRAALSATKPLYTGGRAELGVDLAREGIAAARSATDATRLGVALGAQEAAYAVLRTTQLAGVAAARVGALTEHVRNAEVMEQAGMVPNFDVVQARTELARAEEELISARTGVEQARAQLRSILSLPQETPLTVVEAPPPGTPEGEMRALIDRAWANRPEVQAREAALRIARMNLRLAQRDLRPTVALTGEYARQSAGGLGGTDESWQIGVVAEKPIFDGGARDGKVRSARAAVRSSELELRRTKEQIALEIVRQFLSMQEATERIDTAEQGVVEARERRRMAQLRYREGLAAGIEVIDADTALAAAEASLVNAEYDLQLAVTRLRKAMGIMDLPEQESETQ
ncbi:MAG: TolC family protein [Armatimonadota bacterium]